MANLPADLPENWTKGQIVSPNGTEVGLTEKYGYNYLNRQVNATQAAVNSINTALSDVAQEETVQEINTKIGITSDTGGTSTAGTEMAKLNKLIVSADENKPYIVLDELSQLKKAVYVADYSGELTNQSLLSISGKGILIGYWIDISKNSSAATGSLLRLQVKIDGQQQINYQNTKSEYYQSFALVNRANDFVQAMSTTNQAIANPGFYAHAKYSTNNGTYVKLQDWNPLTLPIDVGEDITTADVGKFVEKPILFNTGLEFNLWKADNHSANCIILYKLLD